MAPQTFRHARVNGVANNSLRSSPTPDSSPEVNIRDLEKELREEFERLVAAHQELLGEGTPEPEQDTTETPVEALAEVPSAPGELEMLRADNAELRTRLEEADKLLEAAAGSEETWLERQKEYEVLLEEKSEVIRSLHHKIKAMEEIPAEKPSASKNNHLEQAERELEEQRRQVQEDEEALMKQMRDMELSLSRDRAELARQRNEIQRLHEDFQREIEMASRDPVLQDRLANLRRRHQEVVTNKSSGTPSPVPPPPGSIPNPPPGKKNSGFFGRLFGGTSS